MSLSDAYHNVVHYHYVSLLILCKCNNTLKSWAPFRFRVHFHSKLGKFFSISQVTGPNVNICMYSLSLNCVYIIRIRKTVYVLSASASGASSRAARDAASMGRNPTLNQSCDFLLWSRAIGRPRLHSAAADTHSSVIGGRDLRAVGEGGATLSLYPMGVFSFQIFFFYFWAGSAVVCVSRDARAVCDGCATRSTFHCAGWWPPNKINCPKLVVLSQSKWPAIKQVTFYFAIFVCL